MRLVAIDPGLSGGIAVVDENGKFLSSHAMPKKAVNETKREVDATVLARLLKDADHVVVERSRPFPQQGVASCYRIGENAGVIRGVLAALGIPFTLVEARVWKKYYNLQGGRANKPLSISRAIDLYPAAPLAGDFMEGRAEALLMARWYALTQRGALTPSAGLRGRAKSSRSLSTTP